MGGLQATNGVEGVQDGQAFAVDHHGGQAGLQQHLAAASVAGLARTGVFAVVDLAFDDRALAQLGFDRRALLGGPGLLEQGLVMVHATDRGPLPATQRGRSGQAAQVPVGNTSAKTCRPWRSRPLPISLVVVCPAGQVAEGRCGSMVKSCLVKRPWLWVGGPWR